MSTRAVSSGWCLQMEFGGDHVHAACRLSSLLAQETNADAAHDLGREIWLLIPRMGGPLGHCQRLGRVVFSSQLVPFKKTSVLSPFYTDTGVNQTLHVVFSDHSDAGGGPHTAIHSHWCSQPLVLFWVCGEWSATVQSIQEVQGEIYF